MQLLKHQERFEQKNPHKKLVCWEGGAGKTVGACVWLRKGRDTDAVVICPKKIIKKWEKALEEWGTRATVVSKEQFKKLTAKDWSAIVVDEADEFASPLFVAKKRSQLSAKLYEQIRTYPHIPILLLTATPIRSNPWNLHTLLCYIGIYIDWKEWRAKFFELQFLPYLPKPAYMPRPNWRQLIRPILEKHADIVLLRDCVDELPPVTEEKVKVETPKFERQPDSKAFFDEHRHEQQNKVKHILEIGKKYRKVLVVAYYVEQVESLLKELSKDRDTYAIWGGVKDQEKVVQQAQESDECFFIVQASSGAGFDADSFSCAVFASMSYSVRDYMQMTYRIRRVHNLHPVWYYFLLGGRCDKAVLHNIQLGKDFIPSTWS